MLGGTGLLHSARVLKLMASKQPFFILCPLRSFSSVVCTMLGQHPDMYGFPELNLFIADTLGGVMNIHRLRPHGAHGLYRTLAQLHDGEQTEASVSRAIEWVEQRRSWSSKQVLDYILDWIVPRIGVDKSPRTVMKPEYLRRMHATYPDANYLHLVRHPRSTAISTKELLKRNDEWEGLFDADWVDPERVWLRTHKNVVDFAATLPEGQCMRIKGEDLLSDPHLYLPQIAEWLGIRTDRETIEAMLHPEQSPYACFGPENAKYGNDPNFLGKPAFRGGRIKEPSLEGDLDWAPGQQFSKPVLKLAREFGYS